VAPAATGVGVGDGDGPVGGVGEGVGPPALEVPTPPHPAATKQRTRAKQVSEVRRMTFVNKVPPSADQTANHLF